MELIEGITTQLKRVMQPGVHVLPPGFIDRLADAIVSVEYYMETLQAGRADPWYMLDNAQACVQALEQQPTPSVPTVAPLEPGAYAKTVQITQRARRARRSRTRPRWMRRPRRSRSRCPRRRRSPSTPTRSW